MMRDDGAEGWVDRRMNRETLISKLESDLARGHVVTIVGTGVSVAACGNQEVEGHRVATWTGLLEHGVKHCRDLGIADEADAAVLEMQIAAGKTGKANFLIAAAEDISRRLLERGDGVFRGWLRDTVGSLRVQHPAIVQAVAALPGVLATLNYDHLLEDATGRRAVTWQQPDKVQQVLRREIADAVLHLHGWFDEPDSVVLGLASYLRVKDSLHARAVLELFTIGRTLLFVGCGDTMSDPNFGRLVAWGRDALSDVAPRHYLLCRTSELPAFRAKLAAAPWLQPLDYGAAYSDLEPFLRARVAAAHLAPAPVVVEPGSPGIDLAAYREAMRRRYGRVKLEELDATTHDARPVTVTGMFIAQSARECAEFLPRVFELPKEIQHRLRASGDMEGADVGQEVLDQHRRAYLDQSPRPITSVVDDPTISRLVVLGDPGSGKSMLLQYLLLRWAERGDPDPSSAPLPLLIELREYARSRVEGQARGFLDYLHAGEGVRWHLDQSKLDRWLHAHPAVVLFDGLDEIFDPALRREISTAIHRFADEYPRARLIVTSRIIGYQHQAWRDEGFRHFMLQELDAPEIAAFLARWHRDVYEVRETGEAKRTLLVHAINDSRAIRQLAGNPLLLTMMAILNRTQDLPRDRAELYEQCARLLLHHWKMEVAFSADPELAKASLDFKDKRDLLLRVARTMQTSERGLAANLIDEATLEATLAEWLKSVPDVRPERAARALIHQLRGRNFILCAVGGNAYAFVHRTFLEYFTAVEIRERFQSAQTLTVDQLKTDIFGHWRDGTWEEVLCLLAGMIAPHFVAQILTWLLPERDSAIAYRRVFLAARCVGEVRTRAELHDIEPLVRVQTEKLMQYDLDYDYQLVREGSDVVASIRTRAAGLMATVWRDAPGSRAALEKRIRLEGDHEICRAIVWERARGWKDDPDTFRWLKARAQSDSNLVVRRGAVEALACWWSDEPEASSLLKALVRSNDYSIQYEVAVMALSRWRKHDPETLAMIKAHARSTSWSAHWIAIRELARGWKDDPETLTLLKAHARSHASGSVRLVALHELARGWKDDPDTLPTLRKCVQLDDDAAARLGAIKDLARGWKNDPETWSMLRACVQSEGSVHVRQTAMRELVRGWKDDPETVAMLKVCAQLDASFGVRQTAMEELARGWRDDAETLAILKTSAQSADSNVRWAALYQLAHGWEDDPETLTMLHAAAQFDVDSTVRWIALQELARGWKEEPNTLPILKASAQADAAENVRRTAIHELARRWKDDHDTLPTLERCMRSDASAEVRRAAMRELVRGWKHDPDTLSKLVRCMQSDADAGVRREAIQELARGWEDHPEALAILKRCVQSSESSDLRQEAIQELARRWCDDPETLAMLKARAQSDLNAGVRGAALQELAGGWSDDPETLAILMARAQSDGDYYVRCTAIQELVRGWRDVPDAVEIVRARAHSDDDVNVRRCAVLTVARDWKGDSETLAWIKGFAQFDDHARIRQVAVEALAEGWADDPETLAWLKARALSDADAEVRQSAIDALARRWKHDPETQQ